MAAKIKRRDLVPTPELGKIRAVHERSQSIGEFIDWLEEEKGYRIAEYEKEPCNFMCHEGTCRLKGTHDCHTAHESTGELYVVNLSREKILAEFFEIDLNKVEEERRALLKEQRRLNGDTAEDA